MPRLLYLLVLLLLWPATYALGQRKSDGAHTLQMGHEQRSYVLFVPNKIEPGTTMPLLIALHGGGGSGQRLQQHTGLNAVARRERFVVVYPNGLHGHWNDGRSTVQFKTDDVAFVRALIDRLRSQYPIDHQRIYAVGISNGGMMAQRLACEMSDVLAGIVSVSATLPTDLLNACNPTQPVPVCYILGTQDPLMPYQGGTLRKYASSYGGTVLSAEASVQFWVSHNMCYPRPETLALPTPNPDDPTSVTQSTYSRGKAGSSVVLITIHKGGHGWPGSGLAPNKLIGYTSTQLDASRVLWQFLRQHRRP